MLRCDARLVPARSQAASENSFGVGDSLEMLLCQRRTAEQLPSGGVEKALLGKVRTNIEAGHLTPRVNAVRDSA